jgi:hypothetical protein
MFELLFDVVEVILVKMGKDIGTGVGLKGDFLLGLRFVFGFGLLTGLDVVEFWRLGG